MIEIRNPQKNEKEKIKNLWRYCFNDTEEFMEYYFSNRYSEENAIALFDEDILTSMLHLNKYKLNIRNIEHNSSYVVGVSVAPEYRGRGLMKKLIGETLNYQYKSGEIFSILMPIETDIYLRYGYINCFDISEYMINLEDIIYKKTACKIRKVESITKDIFEDLNSIYNYVVEEYNVYNIRDKNYWENKLNEIKLENGELFLVYDDNEIRSYFTLFPKNPDYGLVSEFIFSTKESFQSMLNIIKSHSTQFKKVKIFTPQSFRFFLCANNNNKFVHIRKPFMMGRVINAHKVLENIFKEKDLSKYNFELEVVDNHIDANNFVYSNKNGNSKYKNGKIDISALAQLYTKYANIEELYIANKFETDDLFFFEKLFGTKKCENYINEYF